MLGLFLGILLAILIGFLVGSWIMCIIDCSTMNDGLAGFVITLVAFTIIGGFVGVSVEKHSYKAFEAQYTAEKQMIEQSVENEKLSGFERVELVKQAAELNASLAGNQYHRRQWYGFAIPDSIFDLTPVSLTKE